MTSTILASTLLASAACGYAQVVRQDDDGGTFELRGDARRAGGDARAQIVGHCGSRDYSLEDEARGPRGETLLTYRCGSGPETAAPGGSRSIGSPGTFMPDER